MIERNKPFDDFDVFCDEKGCDVSENYDVDGNWEELISQMKSDGWRISKQNGEWFHTCPDCASDRSFK